MLQKLKHEKNFKVCKNCKAIEMQNSANVAPDPTCCAIRLQ
jgi:hypothetical protein